MLNVVNRNIFHGMRQAGVGLDVVAEAIVAAREKEEADFEKFCTKHNM